MTTIDECPCGLCRAGVFREIDTNVDRLLGMVGLGPVIAPEPSPKPVTPNWRAVVGASPPCKPDCPYCRLVPEQIAKLLGAVLDGLSDLGYVVGADGKPIRRETP